MLHLPASRRKMWVLNVSCVFAFVGVWIEKGMGLIVPGFVPSTLHEMVEYVPSLTEWRVTAGIWAFGLMLLTVGVKVALPVLSGQVKAPGHPASEQPQLVGQGAAAAAPDEGLAAKEVSG